MALHKDLTGADLHEIKGASTATSGQIPIANGSGGAPFTTPPYSFMKVGWYDYNDVTTQTTPIALSVIATKYDLTNDAAGANTNISFGLPGVTNIWNSGTGRFVFTDLTIGDTLDIRVDTHYTTTAANTALSMELELATGTGTPIIVPLISQLNFKTAGTYQVVQNRSFYIGSALVRDNPARIRVFSDSTGSSIKVNGWFTRAIKPS
jgi:hypothetical protein